MFCWNATDAGSNRAETRHCLMTHRHPPGIASWNLVPNLIMMTNAETMITAETKGAARQTSALQSTISNSSSTCPRTVVRLTQPGFPQCPSWIVRSYAMPLTDRPQSQLHQPSQQTPAVNADNSDK